jgi:death-on-curing protein
MSNTQPDWLLREAVLALHEQLLDEHGGLGGIRDRAMLDSALDRPRNQWHYGGERDLFTLAAGYADAIANNHPFNDGNKRTAFMCAYTFLAANRWEVDADEAEVVVMTVGLADKSVPAVKYGQWLRDHSKRT